MSFANVINQGRKPEDESPPPEPLVLWEDPDGSGAKVEVEPMLCRWLRPHQREGVKFVFECVCGLRKFDGQGATLERSPPDLIPSAPLP